MSAEPLVPVVLSHAVELKPACLPAQIIPVDHPTHKPYKQLPLRSI